MKLRLYQITTIDRIEAGWTEFDRQLAVLPTGSGKTIIAAHVAKRWTGFGKRVLFLAHRKELLDQTIDKFARAAGIHAQLEKAEAWASNHAEVVVGSVQTFSARGYRWDADHFDLVIVDEAHHVLADSYRAVLGMFPAAKVLGITATPDRGDKKNLGAFFQAVAHEVRLFDLIHEGYLAPIVVKAIPISIDLTGVKSVAGDFNDAELGDRLEPYLDQIAAAIRDHASFRRVLGFAPLIATSQKCVEACRKVGLVAEMVHGLDPEREIKLRRFAAGDYDVLWNAMLLTEGFDDPGIDCIVVLRPTRSRPLYCQMIGRGTRIHPTKDNLLLLDPAFLHERHKVVKPANLIATTEEEAEVISRLAEEQSRTNGRVQPELDLENLATAAQGERERALAKRLAEQKDRKVKVISAEEFALQHHRLDVAEFEPVMEWEAEQVSEKQAWLLKRHKIDLETVKGKGHASRIIDLIKADERITLASPAQRWKMKQMGFPNADVATQADARQFFAKLRGRQVA